MLNQGANQGDRRSPAEKQDNLDKRLGKQNGTKSQHGNQNYGKHIYSQKRGANVRREPGTISPHKKSITGK
ncbi:MAG: hypothetical protein DRI44_04660 [Chlamydiae bacterium]|nr:MAG: hypothetical protein DRI44_04660 [Chlamydiota bacterium]